jgi:hypothetical protein
MPVWLPGASFHGRHVRAYRGDGRGKNACCVRRRFFPGQFVVQGAQQPGEGIGFLEESPAAALNFWPARLFIRKKLGTRN